MDYLATVENLASADEIAEVIHRPRRVGNVVPYPSWVPRRVCEALETAGIDGLWEHQARAANNIFEGTHTVLATGTGSGKSLAAWIPMAAKLVESRASTSLAAVNYRPTALYLSPTKALAADQFAHAQTFFRNVDRAFTVGVCDGDSDDAMRTFARNHADIVMSNPDFLHHGMLSRHESWSRLLRGLSLIIIDEFHSYRGIFGAHVAHTVRRLLRVATHYGARPTVVFLSATTANPVESARLFIGESFGEITAVTEDTSPKGEQNIVFWRGTPKEEGSDVRRSSTHEAAYITANLVAAGARVLCFIRSRAGSETVASAIKDQLERIHPENAGRIAAYRGGLLPEERRDLEERLRSGAIRALATTSALELGIDISGLDAVVISGWPRTHASFHQQMGRAGRAGEAGVGVFIAREDPLDQYLLENPETIFTTNSEAIVFDPLNPTVLAGQLCVASAELPLTEKDCAIFSLPDTSLFQQLEREGMLRRRPAGWFWAHPGTPPHSLVNLRGENGDIAIVDRPSGALIGTASGSSADTSVYPGAIYVHQGVPFEVEHVADGTALVHEHRPDELRTFATEENHVVITATHESIPTACGVWAKGEVAVTSTVKSYDIRRERDGVYLGTKYITMPQRVLHTGAVWWTYSQESLAEAGVLAEELPGALHGAEHAAIGMLPLFAQCDRWDLGGLSTQFHGDTGVATIIVHDAVEGGSGFCARGFEKCADWIGATYQSVASCPCARGCPRCIQSPKCGNNNSPLSKGGAIAVLELLLNSLNRAGN